MKVDIFKLADFTVATVSCCQVSQNLPSSIVTDTAAKGKYGRNLKLHYCTHSLTSTPLPNYTPTQEPHSTAALSIPLPNYTAAQGKDGRSLNLQHFTPSLTSHSITMIIHLLSMVTPRTSITTRITKKLRLCRMYTMISCNAKLEKMLRLLITTVRYLPYNYNKLHFT